MTFATIFHELAAILVLAGVIGVLALKLRQPLIIGYILTGILVGPAALGWSSGGSELKLLSSIGIAGQAIRLVLVGSAFVLGTAATMRWVMPPLLGRLAQNQELLVLFAVAWAVGLAALADAVGFSKEVGAFLGGVSIASTAYREAIASRLTGLRDFLLLFFFIDLGSGLNLSAAGLQLGPALVLSAFVLVGNPLVVVAIMGVMGYRRRTGLLAGLTVAQISEFSLILAALGLQLGQLGQAEVSLITLVGVITIGLSTYMILGSEQLYAWLQEPLRVFQRATPFSELGDSLSGPVRVDVILLGLGRFGSAIYRQLQPHNLAILGIDFDPQALRLAAAQGLPVQYGDSEDPEFTSSLPLSSATVVVSTLPSLKSNTAIRHGLQAAGFQGHFIATAHDEAEVAKLEFLGAQRTLLPFLDAAERAAELIVDDLRALRTQLQ